MITDHQLLQAWINQGNQEAFAQLVQRHLPMVYSAALRQVTATHLAEDVTQIVFRNLAMKAPNLPKTSLIAGWLHTDTRFTALQLLRQEQRRARREQEASQTHYLQADGEPNWEQIRPLLDEMLQQLKPIDRDALLLRFFEQYSFGEVADALSLLEEAVRMRIYRALDKLREHLMRRGITTTSAALANALVACSVETVPAAMTESVVASALAVSLAGTTSVATTTTLLPTIIMTQTKATLVIAVVAVGLAAPVFWQYETNQRLHQQIGALQLSMETLRQASEDYQERLRALLQENGQRQNQSAELARLRAEVTRLRSTATPPAASTTASPQTLAFSTNSQPVAVTEAEVASFLQRPAAEQGQFLGGLRHEMMTRQISSPEAFIRNRNLAEKVRPQLENLESRPDEFAAFQTSFIQSALNLQEESKLSQIRDIIRKTYEQAVANGLDAASRPDTGVEEWAARRDALDRPATQLVQSLFSPEERDSFDRAFLGIMGIDLGINDGSWHRFINPDGSIVFPSENKQP